MKRRHIPDCGTTLCGRQERSVVCISYDHEASDRDVCKSCYRRHRVMEDAKEEARIRNASFEKTLKLADEILSKPCCNGACGAP